MRDFTGEIMQGLSGIGQIGTALNDRKKADLLAKEGAARLKESEQIQLLNQQKIDAGKTAANQDAQARQISSETEARGMMTPAALEGTKTATGNAVDFQAVKTAKQADSDAKLYNMLNQGKEGFLPLNGRALAKMKEDKALAGNQADQEAIRTEERATETHKSKMETEKAAREAGRYTAVALGGDRLGALNTRTGKIADTGETTPPKPETGGHNRLVAKQGETLIPDLQPIAGVEITNDSVKKTKDAYATAKNFKRKLAEYKKNIETYGSELIGEKADEMTAQHVGLGMALKELDNLGVLTGGDWKLTLDQIPKASGIGASMKGKAYGAAGADAFGPKLDVVDKKIDTDFDSFSRANGFERVKAPAAGGASGSWGAPAGGVDKRAMAKQAINDPEATEQEKAAARRILGR